MQPLSDRPQAAPVANDADTSVLPDLRFQRDVERLHRLGPRSLYGFLAAVGAERSIRTYLEDRITDFASLDADVLAALDVDRMPLAPLRRWQAGSHTA